MMSYLDIYEQLFNLNIPKYNILRVIIEIPYKMRSINIFILRIEYNLTKWVIQKSKAEK